MRKEEAELTAVSCGKTIWFHSIPDGNVWCCGSDGTLYPDPLPDPIDKEDRLYARELQLRHAIVELWMARARKQIEEEKEK